MGVHYTKIMIAFFNKCFFSLHVQHEDNQTLKQTMFLGSKF